MEKVGNIINLQNPLQQKTAGQFNEPSNKGRQGNDSKPEIIDTGKTETCISCGENKRVLKRIDPKRFGGYRTEVEACRCDKEIEKQQKQLFSEELNQTNKQRILKYFNLNDADEDFKRHSFNSFIQRSGTQAAYEISLDYCNRFDDFYKPKGVGLMLTGEYGNGKTRLIKTILNSLKRWNTCIFVEYTGLCDRIQATYSKQAEENEAELFKCLISTDILAIDEIGVGEKRPDREKILLRIIEDRKKIKKPILFTMNPEGESQLAGRIKSRIDEICIFEYNQASDFRPEALQMRLEGIII